MTKRITLTAARAMTTQWFANEWSQSFPGCTGAVANPLRLEDLLAATFIVWKGKDLSQPLLFPSGNHGSAHDVFGCYKSGPDFLEDLLTACGRAV